MIRKQFAVTVLIESGFWTCLLSDTTTDDIMVWQELDCRLQSMILVLALAVAAAAVIAVGVGS